MRRRRAHEARSAADRDLQRQIGRAEAAVRAALSVCGRASRKIEGASRSYQERARQLQAAEKHLERIGHMDSLAPDQRNIQSEARALVSWLDSREQARGIHTPARRGQEYQERLAAALRLLEAVKPEAAPPTDMKSVPVSDGPAKALQMFGVPDGA